MVLTSDRLAAKPPQHKQHELRAESVFKLGLNSLRTQLRACGQGKKARLSRCRADFPSLSRLGRVGSP